MASFGAFVFGFVFIGFTLGFIAVLIEKLTAGVSPEPKEPK